MICPAILDPFQGSNYRLYACIHQAFLCPIVSKCFAYVFTPATSSKEVTESDIKPNSAQANNFYIKHIGKHNDSTLDDLGAKSFGNGCDNGSNLSNDLGTTQSFGSDKKLQ